MCYLPAWNLARMENVCNLGVNGKNSLLCYITHIDPTPCFHVGQGQQNTSRIMLHFGPCIHSSEGNVNHYLIIGELILYFKLTHFSTQGLYQGKR